MYTPRKRLPVPKGPAWNKYLDAKTITFGIPKVRIYQPGLNNMGKDGVKGYTINREDWLSLLPFSDAWNMRHPLRGEVWALHKMWQDHKGEVHASSIRYGCPFPQLFYIIAAGDAPSPFFKHVTTWSRRIWT